jgi:CheY-like chemotaxis protein/anti-sigma regulatory factor (Ser/Thr protein kinase)
VHVLRHVVDDLLDVARVTSGKIVLAREAVDLAVVAHRAVAALEAGGRLARHDVKVEAGTAWVEGDETRLEQVVTNLVDNAARYTPEGGHIAVRVGTGPEGAHVEVEDDGSGISQELLPRVFDLFTQGQRTIDRAQGGLGLGLALVRRLVELHGGRVRAESAGPGRGARFTVLLKAIPPPLAAPAAAEAPRTNGEPLSIVVVEDNPDGRETLMAVLEMQGHEVHGADSGPAGLDALRRYHPDLAIVDIGLPGFDGYELARRVRAVAGLARTRLVALTGYGQEEDRAHAKRAGFDWFLVKPADMGAIARIIGQV